MKMTCQVKSSQIKRRKQSTRGGAAAVVPRRTPLDLT